MKYTKKSVSKVKPALLISLGISLCLLGWVIYRKLGGNPSTAGSSDSNICNLKPASESTLGSYASERSFNVGALLSECFSEKITPDDQTKCLNSVSKEFVGMSVSFQVSWREVEPSSGQYNWTRFDKIVSFAKNNNIKLYFYHLIWSNHARYVNPPKWVFPDSTVLTCGTRTRADLELIMKNHIQTVISRGGDTVGIWNVVNEAFNDDGTPLQDCFYKILGQYYIDSAFKYARASAPNAVLVLSDYFPNGGLYRSKVDGFFSYVKAAKARGVPIDAVGIQNHLLGTRDYQFRADYISDLTYFLNSAKAANVGVYITEMDVYQAGRSQDAVAKVYKDTVALCLNYSNCNGVTPFGVSDKYSWARTEGHAGLKDAKPLLFDENYVRKPAYYAVMDAIRENTTRSCLSGGETLSSCYEYKDRATCEYLCGNTSLDQTVKCKWQSKLNTCVETTYSCPASNRCYSYKDKATCENKCGDRAALGVFFKCKWTEQGKCWETKTPCGE